MKSYEVKSIVHDLTRAKSALFFIKRKIYGWGILHFFQKCRKVFYVWIIIPNQVFNFFLSFSQTILSILRFAWNLLQVKKKLEYLDLFTHYFGIFVTFYKIIKMILFIIISILNDKKSAIWSQSWILRLRPPFQHLCLSKYLYSMYTAQLFIKSKELCFPSLF